MVATPAGNANQRVLSAKKKILIVDDEPEFVEMIQMRLEANGYEVVTAHDGLEGLRKAADAKPNLILLDVMMPGMDGFRVLSKLRQTLGTENMSVIMLTARGESKSMFKAQDFGVVDYLVKPCDPKDLLDAVKRHLR